MKKLSGGLIEDSIDTYPCARQSQICELKQRCFNPTTGDNGICSNDENARC